MLMKRLYFLLPNQREARITVAELKGLLGEPPHYRLHVMTHGEEGPVELADLGVHGDEAEMKGMERVLWYSSVVIFVLSLVAMVVALMFGSWLLAGVFVLIAVAMQLSGFLFANRPRNAALDRFRDALAEGEVLLVVDVEREHASKVKQLIHSYHPGAESGGSGWYIDALDH